jgi:hypothetical protein
MMAAAAPTTANAYFRLAKAMGQLDLIHNSPMASSSEKAHAVAQLRALRDPENIPQIQQILLAQQSQIFSPANLVMGQGGEAYLQRIEQQVASSMGSMKMRSSMRGIGVWSWNPNEWGMTQAQADAYELQQATLDAQIKTTDPSIFSTISNAVQGATTTAGSATSTLLWVGAAVLAIWGISEIAPSLAVNAGRTGKALASS